MMCYKGLKCGIKNCHKRAVKEILINDYIKSLCTSHYNKYKKKRDAAFLTIIHKVALTRTASFSERLELSLLIINNYKKQDQ